MRSRGRLSKRSVLTLIGTLGLVGLFTLSGILGNWFAIRNVVIESGERITIDDVHSLINIKSGDNILFADLNRATAQLLKQAWVQSVVVERHYPDVHISLHERRPYAVVALPDLGLMWCDEEGYLLNSFSQSEQEQAATHMTVEGLGAATETAGGLRAGGDHQWRFARAVMRSVNMGDEHPVRLRFFTNWLDVLTSSGVQIRLPVDGLEHALQRLANIWPALSERLTLGLIDLRFDGEFVYQGALPKR